MSNDTSTDSICLKFDSYAGMLLIPKDRKYCITILNVQGYIIKLEIIYHNSPTSIQLSLELLTLCNIEISYYLEMKCMEILYTLSRDERSNNMQHQPLNIHILAKKVPNAIQSKKKKLRWAICYV